MERDNDDHRQAEMDIHPIEGEPRVDVLAAEPLSVSLRRFRAGNGAEVVATAHILLASPRSPILHEVESKPVTAEPGQAIHVRPGQTHRFVPQTTDGWVVVVADDRTGPLRGSPVVDLGGSAELAQLLFTVIIEPTDLPRPYVDKVVNACATALLVLVGRASAAGAEPRSPSRYQQITEDFRRAVELGFSADQSVSSYARQIGCSPRTLSRATLETLGRTPRDLIDERIGLAAARLLAVSDTPVAQIARALGFASPSNFARFFKRVMGEAPSSYRTRLRHAAEDVA